MVLLKGILVIAAPLAIVGFYQCITGDNPLGFLVKYNAWAVSQGYIPTSRLGFYRANVVFSHSIMYGLFFAMFGPVCAGVLKSVKKCKVIYWIAFGFMGIGIVSSMSSGPMFTALLSFSFIALYWWRKYWKPITLSIIVMCGTVEIISNRHFYDILGGFTLSPATAWYRSRLIDVAFNVDGVRDVTISDPADSNIVTLDNELPVASNTVGVSLVTVL